MPRRSSRGPAVAALAAITLVGCSGTTPTKSTAQRFVAPQGHDGGDCRAAQNPCRSVAYAYARANDGDRIVLQSGAHGEVAIPRNAEQAPAIELIAQRGASVKDLTVAADRVTVRGVTTGGVSVDAGDRGVTAIRDVRLLDVQARTLWIRRAERLGVRGGSYGDVDDVPAVSIAAAPASRDVSFDGVLFHDARATREDIHTECLWAAGVQGLAIRRSRFRDCAYFDVFLTRMGGPDPRDVVIEHSILGHTVDWRGGKQPFSVNVANWVERVENYHFRGNTFGGDIAFQPKVLEHVALTGNRGGVWSCRSEITYSGNTWSGGPCGPSDHPLRRLGTRRK